MGGNRTACQLGVLLTAISPQLSAVSFFLLEQKTLTQPKFSA
jgi:hypothetical protein